MFDFNPRRRNAVVRAAIAGLALAPMASTANAAVGFSFSPATEVRKLATTPMKWQDGAEVSLGFRVTYYWFFLPYRVTADGYALKVAGKTDIVPLDREQVTSLQRDKLLPADLPAYGLTIGDHILGHLLWILALPFAGWLGLRKWRSQVREKLEAKARAERAAQEAARQLAASRLAAQAKTQHAAKPAAPVAAKPTSAAPASASAAFKPSTSTASSAAPKAAVAQAAASAAAPRAPTRPVAAAPRAPASAISPPPVQPASAGAAPAVNRPPAPPASAAPKPATPALVAKVAGAAVPAKPQAVASAAVSPLAPAPAANAPAKPSAPAMGTARIKCRVKALQPAA